MHNIHYLETSAINVFADELDDFDFNRTFQKVMKIDFCISPVGIWEILLNSDDSRKDRLIYWVQFNCPNYLLKSPAEIIIGFLAAGTPSKDRKTFWLNRESLLPISKTWRQIHGRTDRTIPIDLKALVDRTEPLRKLSRMHKNLIHSMTDKDEHGHDGDFFHRMMLKLRTSLGTPEEQIRSKDKLTKTALILAFFFVCTGIDLDNSPVRDYWKPIGIKDPFDRLEYIVSNIPLSIVRGPLIEMALMMNAQVEMMNSTNRGTLFDAMHTIYCYYADNTISNDPHFTGLRTHTGSKIYKNIVLADEYVKMLQITHKKLTNKSTRTPTA